MSASATKAPAPASKEVEVQARLIRAEAEATFWRKLAVAKTHPMQLWIMHVLQNELPIASPKKLEQLSGLPLGNISYHVKELEEKGLIELVKTEPRRGAVEHFYRAVDEDQGE